ncbi:DUF6169 family protein [Bacteroides thetaiotaomicron]|uniref:DUF6169 family protein n=1 Tax=Bacteroides thetaiotaomicron TaxID=818 RepID=UPI001F30AC50|nr:DUF6169 family protein [Bacteroides thetaiotaomicron]MCE8952155.1 hypothetical protein [Bacteroides thetaiotaomicron]MCE8969478.1 hypothetical protein [Bacteroides thetaiotaomicron]UVR91394.1 DUF6169 family protein [Bacteroides thetaiotaomicron]
MYCLSIEQINQISPYKVEAASDGNSLIFHTQYGLTYEVGFVEDYTFFDENAYQFFIVEKNGKRFLKDSLVRATVWAIVETFFQENCNVLLYVCDTSDGKQAIRDRLFEIWFYEYEKQQEYVHLAAKVESDAVYYFASVILRATHPQLDEIRNAFELFTEEMKDKLA